MARRELTVEEHWSEFAGKSDGECRVGVCTLYVVSAEMETPITVEVDPARKLRTVRRFRRGEDGRSVTHTNVYEREPRVAYRGEIVNRPDGCVEQSWVLCREACGRPDGFVHPADPEDRRFFVRRSFLDRGVQLALWVRMRLPSTAIGQLPGVFSGEVNLCEEGRNISTTFAYSKIDLGEREGYVLSGIGEIQEVNRAIKTLDVDVDFDALDCEWRDAQLPGRPAEWMSGGGWKGRSVSMELEDGTTWVSDGEAVWTPPDPSDTSMALVLTGGEGYFYGPRTIVPVEEGARDDVVFEAGKRISDESFQRVVWRYDPEGSCVRIDHELYCRETR